MSDQRLEGWTALFRVDRARREVSGLVLPFGVHSRPESTTGHHFLFNDPETIEVPEDDPASVLLYPLHDHDNPVGHGISLRRRKDGVYGTFAVDDSPEGDQALDDIDEGKLRGFSADVAQLNADCQCSTLSRRHCDCEVISSRLFGASLVDHPAFDAARFTAGVVVTGNIPSGSCTRKGAPGMSDKNGGEGGTGQNKDKGAGTATVLDTPDAGMVRFTQELEDRFKAITEHVEKSAQASGDAIAKAVSDAITAAFGRLQDIDATGRGAEAAARIKVISEPPVYRFSGDGHAPSLVRDAWRAFEDGDHEARARLRKFQEQQADLVKLATVTTGTVPEVIPPGYRPDLYVTQLMQGRPLVSLASRGTITDATPFKVPRFVSATGATADHVQGVNPVDGTLDVDDVTVTPGAVSGLFKLTREIVDASNPAIDAIAMQAMRESWNRQTEQKAYAELNVNANVGFSVDVSLGALNGTAVQKAVAIRNSRSLLAKYPFTRFGSPTGAVMGQLVTSAFAEAEGSDGRPLLPSVGAQNAAGVGNAVQQGWFVDGLPHVPAWAITQAIGDELALIVNREDWWVWESPLLTFRFEERSGPAHIELALFGYYATRVLRPAGIFTQRAIA